MKTVKADVEAPFRTRFLLMTTASASEESAAYYLRAARGERNEEKANDILLKTATTSVNEDNTEAYVLYKGMSTEVRSSFLKAVTVLDNAPNITDVLEEIRTALYLAAPKEQIASLVERLEGWWFGRVIEALVNQKTISVLAIEQRIDELREEFKRDALPVDFRNTHPTSQVIADLDQRPFVKQLRKIKIGASRIEYAIRDYYRAFEQRSRWLRQDLLLDGELERYEQGLKEAWEPRFHSVLDGLPTPCSAKLKVEGGQKVFQWAEQEADFPLRTVRERFLTHGSFHILANRYAVGWHPDFAHPETSDESKEEK